MVIGLLKKLLGAGGTASAPEDADPVEHEGFTIIAAPVRDGAGWRVAGRIVNEADGKTRTHEFVRADTFPDRTAAIETAVLKGRRIIDERGARLFED